MKMKGHGEVKVHDAPCFSIRFSLLPNCSSMENLCPREGLNILDSLYSYVYSAKTGCMVISYTGMHRGAIRTGSKTSVTVGAGGTELEREHHVRQE